MAYEDFTTYTEYDPNNVRTVTTNKVACSNLLRSDSGYLKRDCGTDFFDGDFSYDIDFYKGTGYDAQSNLGIFALTNGANTIQEMVDGSDGLCVYFYRNPSYQSIYLHDFSGSYDIYYADAGDTIYYLTIERVGYSVFLKRYCWYYLFSFLV